jgi:phosphate transport system substrate-binding protein
MNKVLALATVATLAMVGTAHARDNVRIVGSSTVFPFSSTVAEQFGNAGKFPAPVVESTGTGGGFKFFCAGVGVDHPDMTGASRAIKSSEVEQCKGNGVADIVELKIGSDGIAFANSKQGPQGSFTKAQLWQGLAKTVPVGGKMVANPYKNWSEIDSSLPNEPIEVLGPPPTSGTRDAWVELVMAEGCAEFPEVKALDAAGKKAACDTMREDGAFIEAGENDNLIVQKLQADPKAFGIFGFSFLDQNSDTLHGSKIGGVGPTFETITDSSYPVSRPLFLYVKKAHVGVIPGMAEYLAELTSEKALGDDGYLLDKGLIPLPAADRTKLRDTATSLTVLGM